MYTCTGMYDDRDGLTSAHCPEFYAVATRQAFGVL